MSLSLCWPTSFSIYSCSARVREQLWRVGALATGRTQLCSLRLQRAPAGLCWWSTSVTKGRSCSRRSAHCGATQMMKRRLTGCSPGYKGSLTLQLKEGEAVCAYWIGKQRMVHSWVQDVKQRGHRWSRGPWQNSNTKNLHHISGKRLPEEVLSLHNWRYEKQDWIQPWGTCCICVYLEQRSRLGDLQRSLPPLWVCHDSANLLFPVPFLSPLVLGHLALGHEALPPATGQSSSEKAKGNSSRIATWASSFTTTMEMLVVGSRTLYSIPEIWAEF